MLGRCRRPHLDGLGVACVDQSPDAEPRGRKRQDLMACIRESVKSESKMQMSTADAGAIRCLLGRCASGRKEVEISVEANGVDA